MSYSFLLNSAPISRFTKVICWAWFLYPHLKFFAKNCRNAPSQCLIDGEWHCYCYHSVENRRMPLWNQNRYQAWKPATLSTHKFSTGYVKQLNNKLIFNAVELYISVYALNVQRYTVFGISIFAIWINIVLSRVRKLFNFQSSWIY